MADNLKPRSSAITEGPDRAPSRAMLKAVGFTDEDLSRPIVGVANTWIEIGPCNFRQRNHRREHVTVGHRFSCCERWRNAGPAWNRQQRSDAGHRFGGREYTED